MNVAIIIAGGVGSRMNSAIPKQFIEVEGKPIIVYTLKSFQNHINIDAIEVVCISEWIPFLNSLVKKFKLTKVRWIVPGGDSGHASTYNGLKNLENNIDVNDIVVIHDAIRPIVPTLIINDLLETCKKYGNACASLPCHETLILKTSEISGTRSIDRKTVQRVQTPQAYLFGDILSAYREAETKGISNSVYANTLMIELGKEIFFSKGFNSNVKITTHEDIALFIALKSFKEEDLT